MKESVLSIAALAASCALAGTYTHTTYTGSDTNLKTLAVETDGRFVLGTGDYAGEEWTWTKERVYDGFTAIQGGDNIAQRWFEPGWVNGDSKRNWAGYQTTEPVVVTHVSFITRHDNYAERARGCRFEGANTADFSDAVVLYTVPADADVETLKAGWVEVDVAGAALSSPFTYLRVVADDEFCGNFIEVEFYGKTWADATSEAPSAPPQNFTAVGGDANVTLSWDLPSFSCQSVRVVRATAPGGPFTTIVATLAATTISCEDAISGLSVGVKYYYRAYFLNTVGETEYKSELSASASFRRVEQLERTSLSDTQLKAGMSVIGYNWNLDTTGARAFDGDIATFADLNAEETDKVNIKIGVDLGSAYVIDSFKIYPRSDSYLYRLNGVVLGASNDSGNWMNGTAISASCGITAAQWYTFETTDKAAYRYVYVMKPNDGDFYGNVAELALYGYTLASSQSVLLAPENAAAEWHGTRAVITWTASPNAMSYKVERSSDGGATWTMLAAGIADTTYTDRPTKATSIGYIYRVASVDGNGGLAYTISITPTGTPAAPGLSIFFR